jgi:hypothetical protein
MKHLKLYEGMSEAKYSEILQNTPKYYSIFKLTKDYIEPYTDKNKLIIKGTEVYQDNLHFSEVMTICPENYITEVPAEVLDFVEYRTHDDVDKQLEMYKASNKFNI